MTDSSAHTLAGAMALLVTGLAFGTGEYAEVSLSPQSLGASVAESAPLTVALDPAKLRAKSAILYDIKTSRVLYQKNAHEPLPLASLTKLIGPALIASVPASGLAAGVIPEIGQQTVRRAPGF